MTRASGERGRRSRGAKAIRAGCLGVAVVLALQGCSVRKLAVTKLADTLASPGETWSGDDDPELIGDALPFALKTQESLLAEIPEHGPLLVSTCRGFVSYAAGWVEPEAERIETSDFAAARKVRERALRLHLRARGYCLRALDLRFPGIRSRLENDPGHALGAATGEDVELLYWTGAAWGSAIALGLDRPALVADLPAVRALFSRALELDRDYDHGSLEEAMISIEAMPELLGGSAERAHEHFERAVALSAGRRAGPFVTWARGVPVARQDRKEFRRSLELALEIDPEASPPDRLANLLAQDRARRLLDRIDELFFEPEDDEGKE